MKYQELLSEELVTLEPWIVYNYDNVDRLKRGLRSLGYTNVGTVSKFSPWSYNSVLDVKRSYGPEGRFQLRLYSDRTGRLDFDNYDPDNGIINTILHSVVDTFEFLRGSITDSNKNSIDFTY